MKFLEKIQSLPEGTRKIILFSIMIAVTLFLLVFYFRGVGGRLAKIQQESEAIPEEESLKLQEEINEAFQKANFEENIKDLQEQLQKYDEEINKSQQP